VGGSVGQGRRSCSGRRGSPSEQEFFAAREPEIAEATNAAARGRMIAKLKQAEPGTRERALHEEFETAKRTSEASSVFAREGGRFPFSGRGDVNTYALFAELFASSISLRGRAGVIVPTGIATDATTAPFFAALVDSHRLVQLIDFENRERLFAAIDSRMKFTLLTIGREANDAGFAFFLTAPVQLADVERRFTLSAEDIARINPNTKSAPVFRSRADAELIAKIYARAPILMNDAKGATGNPWGIAVHTRIWHMAEDSEWFRTSAELAAAGFLRKGPHWQPVENPGGVSEDYVPLYEAKMINLYDHRFGSYESREDGRGYRILPETTLVQHSNPNFEPEPYYFVPEGEVEARLSPLWERKWLVAFKDVTAATNERTTIFAFLPRMAVGHSAPLLFPRVEPRLAAALVASLNSVVVDYCARTKVGGLHLTIGILAQLPILPPSAYSAAALAFIAPRIIELSYTSHSMTAFARDLSYDGPPFPWDEERRAQLRAELDAWYARAYGLTRDQLRFVLDPADVKGPDYPSETFRVLKKNDIARFGEYRTGRLVLQARDRMERGEVRDISPPIVVSAPRAAPMLVPVDPATLPDGAWARPSDGTGVDAAIAQLAALVKALPGPTAIPRVRLAALYVLEPRYLTRRLSALDQATWRRLVGPAAGIVTGATVAAFAPKIDASWRDAVTQLRGMGAIIEDATAQTWAAGPNVDEFEIDPTAWPFGRAAYVLKALKTMTLDDETAELPAEDQAWVKAHAG
jgi:hypothetical protein